MDRVIAIFAVEGTAVLAAIASAPGLVQRYIDQFLQQLPTHGDSPYFRAMAPGWLAFQEAPLFGIGPETLRLLCDDIIAGSALKRTVTLIRIIFTSRCLVKPASSGS